MYFSTSHCEAAVRKDAWRDAIASHCGPFQVDFGPGQFHGSVDSRRVDGSDCLRITQTSRRVERTRAELGKSDPENFFVILQLAGRSLLDQGTSNVLLHPGQITVIDSGRTCSFGLLEKNAQLSLNLPKSRVNHPDLWHARVATRIPAASEALVRLLLQSSFDHGEPSFDFQQAILVNAVIQILEADWRDPIADFACVDGPSGHAGVMRTIKSYMLRHLDHESMSPQTIARATGVSERQLYRMFQQSGTTVSKWLRQTRLDHCARDLRNPALADVSITQIAFRWGFSDGAHFSRSFKAEFGETPRAYRGRIDESGCDALRGETLSLAA